MTPLPIEQFDAGRLGPYLPAFARLLQKTICGGASLGFLPPLTLDDAEAYWRGVERSVAEANCLLFGVLDADEVVATVQLLPSQGANARHRAELAKLMVAPSHRRQHLAKRLVVHLEQQAAQLGFGTLTLDTRADDPSNLFYRSLGYTLAGEERFRSMRATPPGGFTPQRFTTNCSVRQLLRFRLRSNLQPSPRRALALLAAPRTLGRDVWVES